jgi:hypothetical protein
MKEMHGEKVLYLIDWRSTLKAEMLQAFKRAHGFSTQA